MKLKGALPKGDADGLSPIESGLLSKSTFENPLIALVVLDPFSKTESLTSHEQELTLRIRRIEVILDEDMAHTARILQRAFEKRTGMTTLPIDVEDDIRNAFNVSIDPETGEVIITAAEDKPGDDPTPKKGGGK